MVYTDLAKATTKSEATTVTAKDNNCCDENKWENTVDSFTGMPKAFPVYKFINRDTEECFYTKCELRRNELTKLNNFVFQKIALLAYSTKVKGSVPIYRFRDLHSGEYFDVLTAEREKFASLKFEGIAYYALPI